MSMIASLMRRRPGAVARHERFRHLTDGRGLFRAATEVDAATDCLWLEDCMTLELLFISRELTDSLREVPVEDHRQSAGAVVT
jgi:hypothetical protein